MTILVCLGPSPDTWWRAQNPLGRAVLERAEERSADEPSRKAIFDGRIVQSLNLDTLEPSLRERVWLAVEASAKELADGPPEDEEWSSEWVEHVADLADEMEARRISPGDPGRWPSARA